jgi:hypothetical protein
VTVPGTGEAELVVVGGPWVGVGEDGSSGVSGAEVHAALASSTPTTPERNHERARAGAATQAR